MFNETLPLLKNAVVSFSVTAPNKPSDLEIDFSENNKITVNCKYSHRPKGPEKKFRAFLYKSGTQKPKSYEQRDRCHFEFADLSYLTSYTVEVCITPIANKTLTCFTIPQLINSVICIFRWLLLTDTLRAFVCYRISTLPVSECKYSHTCISHLYVLNTQLWCFSSSCVCHSHVFQFYFADNDKAVIGFLVFLIILVSVALLFVVYKIFILKRGNSRWVSLNCQEWL